MSRRTLEALTPDGDQSSAHPTDRTNHGGYPARLSSGYRAQVSERRAHLLDRAYPGLNNAGIDWKNTLKLARACCDVAEAFASSIKEVTAG